MGPPHWLYGVDKALPPSEFSLLIYKMGTREQDTSRVAGKNWRYKRESNPPKCFLPGDQPRYSFLKPLILCPQQARFRTAQFIGEETEAWIKHFPRQQGSKPWLTGNRLSSTPARWGSQGRGAGPTLGVLSALRPGAGRQAHEAGRPVLGAGDARQLGVGFGSIPRRRDEWERREAERPGGGCGEEAEEVEERRGETEREGRGRGRSPLPPSLPPPRRTRPAGRAQVCSSQRRARPRGPAEGSITNFTAAAAPVFSR